VDAALPKNNSWADESADAAEKMQRTAIRNHKTPDGRHVRSGVLVWSLLGGSWHGPGLCSYNFLCLIGVNAVYRDAFITVAGTGKGNICWANFEIDHGSNGT
jgi:hypothetical protein